MRQQISALAVYLVAASFTGTAFADPVPVADVFCFRFTDIERVAGDVTGNAFLFEFETLNWTNKDASGVELREIVAGPPQITGASIDTNGRGGARGGGDAINPLNEIPPLADVITADPNSGTIHTGRGSSALANDWTNATSTATRATWNAAGGTPIPHVDLIADPSQAPIGLDATGDLAIDNHAAGNVLDGFVLKVEDFKVGDVLTLDWALLDEFDNPIGTVATGNAYGFGIISIGRETFTTFDPNNLGLGPLVTTNDVFYFNNQYTNSVAGDGSVGDLPNPTFFTGNFAAGVATPEPSSLVLAGLGCLVVGCSRFRRRKEPEQETS